MSWTKFKEKYLFTVNFAIMLSILLYGVRKDFAWHWTVCVWLVLCLIIPKVRESQMHILRVVGHINSTLLLTAFYFLFFTPFSFFYRLFYRNAAFKKNSSRFAEKTSISSFDLPF